MTQIIITRKIFDEAIALLAEAGLDFWHNEPDVPLALPEIQARLADAEAMICLLTDQIDAALMDAAPRLKIIANVAVGYDNIDIAVATKRGIFVTNTPGVLTECTADLAFALLLATARRIVEADAYMRTGKFQGWELFQPHLGVDVYGKTVGIVGMGRIGTAVARRAALGFNMNILYTANSPKLEAEQKLGAQQVALPDLLRLSDFVTIHTPLTPQTRHLFTLNQFRQMKETAILINTARGPIVKEADLVQALEEGLIAGAGLDVYEEEPKAHPGLAALSNVVTVPHIGSATTETRRRMAMMAAQNVVAVLGGERPLNPVNHVPNENLKVSHSIQKMTETGGAMLTTKLKQSWIIPAILLALMSLLIWRAPVEQSLGQGIKIVYVHVGLIWVGLLGYALNGLLGLAVAITTRSKLATWLRVIGMVTLVIFVVGVVVSLLAEQVNWGGILWREPRNTAVFGITAVALIVQVLQSWLPWRRVHGLLHLGLAAYVAFTLPATPLVMHPDNPARSSSSTGIQSTFYAVFLLCLLIAAWLIWRFRPGETAV